MDHFLEDHIPSYQMGITVWSCALYGKSNGRVWSGICTFRTFKRKDHTLPLHVEILFNEFQYVPAFAVSSLLVIMAVIILVVRSLIEYKGKKEA